MMRVAMFAVLALAGCAGLSPTARMAAVTPVAIDVAGDLERLLDATEVGPWVERIAAVRALPREGQITSAQGDLILSVAGEVERLILAMPEPRSLLDRTALLQVDQLRAVVRGPAP